jgi:hypothetical protein
MKDTIKEAVRELTEKQQQFTGLTVGYYLASKSFAPPEMIPSSWQIGSYLRELFNGHDAVFKQYACYPVEGNGPLLFFPIPQEVQTHAAKIQKAIEAKQESQPT